MENELITLTAEMVNELEFVPHPYGGHRSNGYKEITMPFDPRDFEAKVSVKVGNAVNEITLRKFDKYVSSMTDKNDRYVSGHHRKYLGIVRNGNPFLKLEEAGIKVDYSVVKEQYAEMVAKAEHTLILEKRFKEWERIRRVKAKYPNAWMHNFVSVLKADRNKKIVASLPLTTFTKPTLEKFIQSPVSHINVTYKGYRTTIHLEDGSYTFRNGVNVETSHTASLTDDKTRRAKREGTIYFKLLEAVDIYTANIEYKKKRREEEVSETEKTRLKLEEVTGYPVYMKEEREYSRHRGRRDNTSWMTQKYYLITEQPDSYYGSFKGIQISLTKNHYEEGEKVLYNVKGCNNLRAEQFKAIVDILVDGREVHKTVITPKREERNY